MLGVEDFEIVLMRRVIWAVPLEALSPEAVLV